MGLELNKLSSPFIMVIILKIILLVFSILNLLDGILTLIGLNHNVIEEYNPVMKILYDFHPLLFLTVKLILSAFLILLSYFIPEKSFVKIITICATVIYLIVCLLHLVWIFILF